MIHENNLPDNQFLKLSFFTIVLLLISFSLQSQVTYSANEDPFKLAEQLYGTSDKLVNGIIYSPLHHGSKGTPFYPFPDYHEGTVFISGSKFSNELIKYNIEIQRLVLKKRISNGAELQVLLFNNRIDSFLLDSKMFINSHFLNDSSRSEGFYEIINRGENIFLAYHRIFFNNSYDRRNPNGKFHTPVVKFYQYDGEKLIRFKNRKQFAALFSGYEKEIKKYMRRNKIKFRKISSEELKKLIQYVEKQN